MNFAQLKTLIRKECKEKGVKFYVSRSESIPFYGTADALRVNGFFNEGRVGDTDEFSPILAISNNKNSLDTLIHEYCHMQQFLEWTPEWNALTNNDYLWTWLDGDNSIDESLIDNSMLAYYAIEVDCERRAVEQHKIWNTGINIEEYIQKANAYTMFYFYVREHRVWYATGREPYTVKDVWQHMPKTFDFDRLVCYNNVHNLFKQCI